MARLAPIYEINDGASIQADTCQALQIGVNAKQVSVSALSRGRYLGKKLPKKALPGICSVGFWDAVHDQEWGIDWQRNEGIELAYLETGRAEFALDDFHTVLEPGQITIAHPWQRHRIGGPRFFASRLHWLILDVGVRRPNQAWQWPSWVTLSDKDREELTNTLRHCKQSAWVGSREMLRCFRLIANAVETDESGNNISRLTVRLNELFVLVLDMFRANPVPLDELLSSSRRTVELFLRDLMHNPASIEQNWTLLSMANHCGLGVAKFVQECRLITNLSPAQYLQDCRIQAACRLIREYPEKSVTDIAMSCGFSSSQYFATVFRRKVGASPREFRINGYTHRVAISNSRIVSLKNDRVSFRYKDYADDNRTKQMTLSAEEFIRRFLLHVLPKGFVRIRHYGLLASRNVSTRLERCHQLLDAFTPTVNGTEEKTWTDRLRDWMAKHVMQCPRCGESLQRQTLESQPLDVLSAQTNTRHLAYPVPILDSS